MVPEEEVTRYLRDAPVLPIPGAVLARLKATLADEVALRGAAAVEPDADATELKRPSRLWVDDAVPDP